MAANHIDFLPSHPRMTTIMSKGAKGEKFQILFVDSLTLREIAQEADMKCEILYFQEDEKGVFLAKIN